MKSETVAALVAQVSSESKNGASIFNHNIGNKKANTGSDYYKDTKETFGTATERDKFLQSPQGAAGQGKPFATGEKAKPHGVMCTGKTECTRFASFDSLDEGLQAFVDRVKNGAAALQDLVGRNEAKGLTTTNAEIAHTFKESTKIEYRNEKGEVVAAQSRISKRRLETLVRAPNRLFKNRRQPTTGEGRIRRNEKARMSTRITSGLRMVVGAVAVFGCVQCGTGLPAETKKPRIEAPPNRTSGGHRANPTASTECVGVSVVPLAESYWFNVLRDIQELGFVLRQEDSSYPGLEDWMVGMKCEGGRFCNTWTQVAEWGFTHFMGVLVVTRRTRGAPGDLFSLSAFHVGKYVIGVLERSDYTCPVNLTDNCYPDATPENESRLACESDLSVECQDQGGQGTVEVLDVGSQIITRLETFRHQGARIVVEESKGGSLNVILDACHFTVPISRSQ